MRPLAYQRALDLFTESVIRPDYELRANAGYQDCYQELMEIRQSCITYENIEGGQSNRNRGRATVEADKTAAAKLESRQMAFAQASDQQ